jgi:hypothetical protein
MTIKALDRRTVLRGMLATGASVAIPLPLLESMLNTNGTALAQSNTALSPLYVTWFFGNGTLPGKWKPAATGVGSAWQLSSQLQPLAEVKSYLTVISGLEGKAVVGGVEHPTGSSAATTGAALNGNSVRAPSIDQIVADLIAAGSPNRSIEIGVTPATPNGPQDSLHTVSHKGPNNRLMPEFDPKAVFNRLFSGSMNPPPDAGMDDPAAKLNEVKRSVLDAVIEDGTSLQQRLGAADRARLEEHLDGIRAIEMRLNTPDGGEGTLPPECSSVAMPSVGKDMNSEAPPAVNTAMAKLASLALACEKTRVLSFMFSLPAAHVYYRHLASNMNADFHDTICHNDPGSQSDQPRVDTGVLYAMRCLNEFLLNMKNTTHGAGNLLDQTLVYVTSDTAWGATHTRPEWPVLLAGKAGGRIAGDQHVNFQGENLSRALLTVAQIMGSEKTELGLDVGRVTSSLPGIMI